MKRYTCISIQRWDESWFVREVPSSGTPCTVYLGIAELSIIVFVMQTSFSVPECGVGYIVRQRSESRKTPMFSIMNSTIDRSPCRSQAMQKASDTIQAHAAFLTQRPISLDCYPSTHIQWRQRTDGKEAQFSSKPSSFPLYHPASHSP
jgi:hypothetical protein